MKLPKPRKLPSGNWFIRLRLGGQEIGVTRPTERDCINAARLLKAEYKAGKRYDQSKEKSLTLSQAINQYISDRKNVLSPATIRGYRTIQKNRFKNVMQIEINHIQNWQKIINDEATLCSAKTLKNAWGFVLSVLRKSGVEPPDITLPQVIPAERPFLSPEQIPAFIDAVKGQPCEIPALLALSSLRRSEIFALTWDYVYLDKNSVVIRGAVVPNENHKFVFKTETKNESSTRIVPIMIPALKTALEAVEDKSGYVVTHNPNTLRSQINRICKLAGLPLVGVHGLRHSFASLAYHLQIPEQIAMEIGGWSDAATMRKIYTHISKSDINRYSNQLKEFYKNGNKNGND